MADTRGMIETLIDVKIKLRETKEDTKVAMPEGVDGADIEKFKAIRNFRGWQQSPRHCARQRQNKQLKADNKNGWGQHAKLNVKDVPDKNYTRKKSINRTLWSKKVTQPFETVLMNSVTPLETLRSECQFPRIPSMSTGSRF
ncbi:unnamed protein product [Peronospora destructor]|uniref:60S ribosomal protein L29 n=1 Tax=Peronospora destructor TaxID=86335 RepID=A0AAV0UPM0_9STRA|nr:unnamed protein product [Peronospora destructor]